MERQERKEEENWEEKVAATAGRQAEAVRRQAVCP